MALRAASLRVGDHFEQVVVEDLTRTQIVMYAGASGDFQPLHTDEPYARAMGFPGVFAHGMLTMGLAGRLLSDVCGADRLLRYRARFLAQVWPGDTLVARATVSAVRTTPEGPEADLELVATNQQGVEVLRGSASARLDP